MATKITIKSLTEKYEKDIARYEQELQAHNTELAIVTAENQKLVKRNSQQLASLEDQQERITFYQRMLDDTNALLARTQNRANQQSIWW